MAQDETAAGQPAEQPAEPVVLGQIRAEGAVPTSNTPLDAPTFYIDSVQGVMLSDFIFKVFFVEQFLPPGEEEIRGRYAVCLAMPTPQMRAIGELFVKLADGAGK